MAHNSEYKKLMADFQMKPLDYKEVADDWEKNQAEWYLALINILDVGIVLAIPNIKIYSWCRCKLVASDKSESHFHWHALVHFPQTKLRSWKRQAQRTGVKFISTKNTFKKILCLDHAVGVLRYIACGDGTKPFRRDADGLLCSPHTHYDRQSIEDSHRNERGKRCVPVRDAISENITNFIQIEHKPNWNMHALHDSETCKCSRGKAGMAKIKEANAKRKAFYKTDAGLEVRRKYREKAETKAKLIDEISEDWSANNRKWYYLSSSL